MWFLALTLGMIYIIQFLWIIINKEKQLTLFILFLFGAIALFIICMFTFILIFSFESILYYTILILFEMLGLTFLNF